MNLISSPATLPGVQVVSGNDNAAPIIGIIAEEKTGKSSLGVTLFGWPEPHMQPLYIAFDESGPDSCVALGYAPHRIRPRLDWSGGDLADKMHNGLTSLESNKAMLQRNYCAIIIDCASVMNDRLLELARSKNGNNPDPRAAYGDVLKWSSSFMNRIVDLGLPTVWLAWLKAAEVHEEKLRGQKVKRQVMGTFNIVGNFKARLAGKSHHNFLLEKRLVGVGTPGADSLGYARILHSVPYQNVGVGGRYSHILPPECPPDLSFILGSIMGKPRR